MIFIRKILYFSLITVIFKANVSCGKVSKRYIPDDNCSLGPNYWCESEKVKEDCGTEKYCAKREENFRKKRQVEPNFLPSDYSTKMYSESENENGVKHETTESTNLHESNKKSENSHSASSNTVAAFREPL